MSEIGACMMAEIKALGSWCMIHGPEIWFVIGQIAIAFAVFDLGVLAGMWLYALLDANGRDDDERH